MQHIDRVDVDPVNIGGHTRPGHDPDPGTGVGQPPIGEGTPERRQLEVEDDGEVQEDDPGGREPEVVHHGGPRDIDVLALDQGSGGVDDVVPEEGRSEDVAPEEDERPGVRVEFRVGAHRRGQPSVEVVDPGLAQVGREGMGEPRFDQGQGAAGVTDHMGVPRPVDRLARAPRWRGAQLGRQ